MSERPITRQHRMTDYEMLRACILSGQVEADQLNAHSVAGDLRGPSEGDDHDEGPGLLASRAFWSFGVVSALVCLACIWILAWVVFA